MAHRTIKAFLVFILLTASLKTFSQLYMTKTGIISFHSHTFLEDIDAENKNVYAVIDIVKKNIAFSMMMKDFVFPRKLMQEHFNENYAESDKYPKASFNGSFDENISISQDGSYKITAKGKLIIHGVTKEVTIPATLVAKDGLLTGTSVFKLNPTDYNISIPFIVRDKIEKENTVKVNIEWNTKK